MMDMIDLDALLEDDRTPAERKFGRLRELLQMPAWTPELAAWIIVGFDRGAHLDGDRSRGESDGWTPLGGVPVDREADPDERFRLDDARHGEIRMTAARLLGCLPNGAGAAHPPKIVLAKALGRDIRPAWLRAVQDDPECRAFLPTGFQKVDTLADLTREDRARAGQQYAANPRWDELVEVAHTYWKNHRHEGKPRRLTSEMLKAVSKYEGTETCPERRTVDGWKKQFDSGLTPDDLTAKFRIYAASDLPLRKGQKRKRLAKTGIG